MKRAITTTILSAALLVLGTGAGHAQNVRVCNPGPGTSGTLNNSGHFYTWFEASSQNDVANCDVEATFIDQSRRRFEADWDQNRTFSEDAVGGIGWEFGSPTRSIRYRVRSFSSNATRRALVGLYGWGCNSRNRQAKPDTPAQEYYVVETWGGSGQFVPFDENIGGNAQQLRDSRGNLVFVDDGSNGRYRVYRVRRDGPQYCGDGSPREFDQFWSVRTSKRNTSSERRLNFNSHSQVWRNHGFRLFAVSNGYQVFAVEAFGAGEGNPRHTGSFIGEVRL